MYGPVRTVVWGDGRGDLPSYPIRQRQDFTAEIPKNLSHPCQKNSESSIDIDMAMPYHYADVLTLAYRYQWGMTTWKLMASHSLSIGVGLQRRV